MTQPSADGAASFAGPADLGRFADAALTRAGRLACEVVVVRSTGGLTRFANSQVHQNVWTGDLVVNVRVATDDGRVGVAGATCDTPADAARACATASALAAHAPPDVDFPGFAAAAPVRDVTLDDAVLGAGAAERAAGVRTVLAEVPADLEAAGAYETGGREVLVATTAGQRGYAPVTSARLQLVVAGPTSSGWAEDGGRRLADLDLAASARFAVGKARAGAEPVAVDAGDWPVVLEPAAVATLMEFVGYVGFGGRDYVEGRSFASRQLGATVFDPELHLYDDALDDDTVGIGMDFEGTPKQRVDLVADGVVAGVVHDRWSGRKTARASTGHGGLAPNPWGAMPANLRMRTGEGRIGDLVAGLQRGLLVTRFHYVNVVRQHDALLTGMTRDGTFLVEDGKAGRPVRNLRFTESALRALARIDGISGETRFGSEFGAGGRWPALSLPAFAFTGTTSFG